MAGTICTRARWSATGAPSIASCCKERLTAEARGRRYSWRSAQRWRPWPRGRLTPPRLCAWAESEVRPRLSDAPATLVREPRSLHPVCTSLGRPQAHVTPLQHDVHGDRLAETLGGVDAALKRIVTGRARPPGRQALGRLTRQRNRPPSASEKRVAPPALLVSVRRRIWAPAETRPKTASTRRRWPHYSRLRLRLRLTARSPTHHQRPLPTGPRTDFYSRPAIAPRRPGPQPAWTADPGRR